MFVLLAIILSFTVGLLRFRTARAQGRGRATMHALLAAAITAVVSLTLWSTGSPVAKSRVCVINSDIFEPFATLQGLLNAGMFMPIGILGVMATRNVATTLVGGFLLTAGIETAQGALTFLGRGCDTSDLQMNTLGVITGSAIGWLAVKTDSHGSVRWNVATRRIVAVWATSAALLAGIWVTFINPENVSFTVAITGADTEQESAGREAVSSAFGDKFKINKIEFARGLTADTGTVIISFDEGFAELSWPDRETFKASLDMSSGPESSGYPVGDRMQPPDDAAEALTLATSYAKEHAQWALRGAKAVTSPVGKNAEMGWMSSWRRRDANGVMLPMRLDIQVDRTGAITQLIERNIEDPNLPEPKISRQKAIELFHQASKNAGSSERAADAELVAKSVEGSWQVHWLAFSETGLAVISATSGEIISYSPQPPGLPVNEVVGEATQ
ncbi:VanZ family protein [Streptomyces sp. SR27]|uniref:VanZ family protein n=1 Tax=Streptomyces sp. SR27 TaxID=3076630 RepID=UPI00295AFDC7|nr:VanZ family protein [Streptomyces sp. SR27]MDV9186881.1 VanZ family protein [Streptomyces sp. SR27]